MSQEQQPPLNEDRLQFARRESSHARSRTNISHTALIYPSAMQYPYYRDTIIFISCEIQPISCVSISLFHRSLLQWLCLRSRNPISQPIVMGLADNCAHSQWRFHAGRPSSVCFRSIASAAFARLHARPSCITIYRLPGRGKVCRIPLSRLGSTPSSPVSI